MLDRRLVDRVMWMQAPILIGGRDAPGAVGDPGVASLEDAPRLSGVRVERVGEDIAISGRLRPIPGAGA
jgi:diaminohydroxyphosphoribosylaminopyrimidine deaminase/5-amino-6-(5-phosphoribosylamino)uracil reductase